MTAVTASAVRRPPSDDFRHEAMLYEGIDGFLAGTVPFIRDSVYNDEPILVVVSAEKIAILRQALDDDAERVDFADMADVGSNPARIIPAWYDFVGQRANGGRYIRGIGEPVSADRSPQALVECQRHESLLNLAFADADAWWLLCPYDTTGLDPTVIEEALRSHPHVLEKGEHRASDLYSDLPAFAQPFDLPLPEPTEVLEALSFDINLLDRVRTIVATLGTRSGLQPRRVDDLVVAANEIATISVRHGGGSGHLRVWTEGRSVVCEIRDGGLIERPLVGRVRPKPGQEGGFGVWLVHQLCDLVQLRTFAEGTVVRMNMALP